MKAARPDHLTVRSLTKPDTSAVALLDVKTWEFELNGIATGEGIDCKVGLYKSGKFVRGLGGLNTSPLNGQSSLANPYRLSIALVPLGRNWTKADEVKCSVGGMGGGATLVQPNFARQYASISTENFVDSDGTAKLMTIWQRSNSYADELSVRAVFKTFPPRN